MRKVLFVILLVAFGVALYWSNERFNNRTIVNTHPLTTIPSKATVIVEANAFSTFWNHFSETNIPWRSLKNDSNFKELNDFLTQFNIDLESYPALYDRINNTPICLAIFGQLTSGIDFLFTGNFSDPALMESWKKLLSKLNFTPTSTTFHEGFELTEWELDGEKYYCSYSSETVHFSSSLSILQSSVTISKSPEQLNRSMQKVYQTASNDQEIKLLIQPNLLAQLVNNCTSKLTNDWFLEHVKIGQWTELDFASNSNALNFFGFTGVDSTSYFQPISASTPIYNECLQAIPNYISSFKWWGFSDYQQFLTSKHMSEKALNSLHTMNGLLDRDLPAHVTSWIDNQFASFTTHANETGIVCRANGSVDPVGKIHDYSVADSTAKTYMGISIFHLNSDFKPQLLFKETTGEFNFCFSYNEYVYFTNNLLSCKKIINALNTNQVLSNDIGFSEFLADKFSDRSNFMYYCNLPFDKFGLYRFMSPEVIRAINEKSSAYKGFNRLGWQMAGNENDLVYHNISVSCNTGRNQVITNNDLWEVTLDSTLIRKPQLLKNHRTKTEEVLVQDAGNNIYIISAAGLVKWKKPIDGPIIGDVKQIDVYGNGKYQMLFNTINKIHLLDINGKSVKGFPVNLPSFASNSLSVFDYQKNHNYRILIGTAQGNVFNFDKTGKLVQGWEFKGEGSEVKSEVKRFVIGNKDYICFHDDNGKIYALDRRGRTRYDIKSSIPAHVGSKRYLVKGRSIGTSKCMYMDSSGTLVEMLFDGSSKTIKSDSNSQDVHFIPIDYEDDGYQDYLISKKNAMEVLGPDMSTQKYLQFNTAAPSYHVHSANKDFFYSIQDGELSLFNDMGELLSEFPKKSAHPPAISDMNKDGKTDIVFTSGNSVIAQILR
jgi:hypothetical protein